MLVLLEAIERFFADSFAVVRKNDDEVFPGSNGVFSVHADY